MGDLFGGYSISHVSGRFRADSLKTREQALGGRYLIDETTAIVRFIVPIKPGLDVAVIRDLFFEFFVRAVVDVARGEDAIWLIEESPEGHKLHTWEKAS